MRVDFWGTSEGKPREPSRRPAGRPELIPFPRNKDAMNTTIETQVQPQNNTPNEEATAPRAVDWENPRVAAILAAAAKCFARKGFSATTLAEIGKELGLRKSIVHYYFASKAALIHEVQSFSQHKYLQRVKEALHADGAGELRLASALRSLWEVLESNRTTTHLNIEVWSASRRDPELKRRAAALQNDARGLIQDGVATVLGLRPDQTGQARAMATLILAVLNGLAVAEFLDSEDPATKQAYEMFLNLLKSGQGSLSNPTPSA